MTNERTRPVPHPPKDKQVSSEPSPAFLEGLKEGERLRRMYEVKHPEKKEERVTH